MEQRVEGTGGRGQVAGQVEQGVPEYVVASEARELQRLEREAKVAAGLPAVTVGPNGRVQLDLPLAVALQLPDWLDGGAVELPADVAAGLLAELDAVREQLEERATRDRRGAALRAAADLQARPELDGWLSLHEAYRRRPGGPGTYVQLQYDVTRLPVLAGWCAAQGVGWQVDRRAARAICTAMLAGDLVQLSCTVYDDEDLDERLGPPLAASVRQVLAEIETAAGDEHLASAS